MRPRCQLRLLSTFIVGALSISAAQAYYDDVHYALTYYIARQAGFTSLQAYRVASADSMVDWSPETEPVQSTGQKIIFFTGASKWGEDPRWKFHAFRNERQYPESVGKGPQATEATGAVITQREKLWASGLAEKNPGVFFHFFQDEDPHRGYGTLWGHWPVAPGLMKEFADNNLPVGGTTDWISYRPDDVTHLTEACHDYMRRFLVAACPQERRIDFSAGAYSGLVRDLARVNAFPKPLQSEFERRQYVWYYANKIGMPLDKVGDPEIRELAPQLGLAGSPADFEKQRKGPDLAAALKVVDAALKARGFADTCPAEHQHYDYDSEGGLDSSSKPDDFVLLGDLVTKVVTDHPVQMKIEMPKQSDSQPAYDLTKPVTVQPNEVHTWENLPVGDLVVLIQKADGTWQETKALLAARKTVLPDIQFGNVSQGYSCPTPLYIGTNAQGVMGQGKWMPQFSPSAGGVSFADPQGKASGSLSWTIPTTFLPGQKVTMTMTASNMQGILRSDLRTSDDKPVRMGVIDPYTSPQSTKTFTFDFNPGDVDSFEITIEASPTMSDTYRSCSVFVTLKFVRGAAPGTPSGTGDSGGNPGATGGTDVGLGATSPSPFSFAGQGATFDGKQLALSASTAANNISMAQAFSKEQISGDVDYTISYSFTPAPSGTTTLNFLLSEKPANTFTNTVQITIASGKIVMSGAGYFSRADVASSGGSGKLRFVRKDKTWTVSQWADGAWKAVGSFAPDGPDRLYLGIVVLGPVVGASATVSVAKTVQ